MTRPAKIRKVILESLFYAAVVLGANCLHYLMHPLLVFPVCFFIGFKFWDFHRWLWREPDYKRIAVEVTFLEPSDIDFDFCCKLSGDVRQMVKTFVEFQLETQHKEAKFHVGGGSSQHLRFRRRKRMRSSHTEQ